LECASNPARGAKHAILGYPYPYSYALNERFFGVFSPGPFPVENVEIPEQTVLLAESGWRRGSGPFGPPEQPVSMSAYTDTGLNPLAYPSPHDDRMNLAAADGHAVSLRIAHYGTAGHDTQFGRVGGALYNWNGGHPNGDTAGPPRE
jgi:prepilin-type processing-associated H-X9-DG protein